jgi:hypothetical protein
MEKIKLKASGINYMPESWVGHWQLERPQKLWLIDNDIPITIKVTPWGPTLTLNRMMIIDERHYPIGSSTKFKRLTAVLVYRYPRPRVTRAK